MASQYTTHYAADSLARADVRTGSPDHPTVLLAFAKLVLIGGALALFTPFWLDLLQVLVEDNWGALRLVALGGGAGIIVLAALFVGVWAGLLKYLARAD